MQFNGCLDKDLIRTPLLSYRLFLAWRSPVFLIASSPRSAALRWPEHGERPSPELASPCLESSS